jgi:hypothetical protein
MQAPKEIIQNKYLQHLTTAHWTCSTAAAVGVGHEIYIYIHTHSLILQVCSLLFNFFETMFMLIFLGLSFLHVWCLKLFRHFFADRSLPACHRKIFSMNL